MPEKAENIKRKLKKLGISQKAVRAAWPSWWSKEAEFSPSTVNDLHFSLARKLGLSPKSLFDEGEATFLWDGDAKYKGLSTESQSEKQALVSFGTSIGQLLIRGTKLPAYSVNPGISGADLRATVIKSGAPYVRLGDLIALSWSIGIPVVYLHIFPLNSKRMAAMAIRTGDRYAILVGRDSMYPAPVAYYVAHELGHIFNGHLSENSAIVDEDMPDEVRIRDIEEIAADEFALTLLTGRPRPILETTRPPRNSRELANAVVKASQLEQIEPGTLALCYAHGTGQWRLAQNAMKHIYQKQMSAQNEVNQVAKSQILETALTLDNFSFLMAVMGVSSNARNIDR